MDPRATAILAYTTFIVMIVVIVVLPGWLEFRRQRRRYAEELRRLDGLARRARE